MSALLKNAPIVGAVLSAIAVVSVFAFNWFGMEDEGETLWKWENLEGDKDIMVYLILGMAVVSAAAAGAAFAMKEKAKMLSIASAAASVLGVVLAFMYYFSKKSEWEDSMGDLSAYGIEMPSLEMQIGLFIFAGVLIANAVVQGLATMGSKK